MTVLDLPMKCMLLDTIRVPRYSIMIDMGNTTPDVPASMLWACGIVVNEEVDKLAKIAAEDVFRDRILASSVISLSAAFKLSSEIAQESWQVKWDQEPTGFFTRQLIPEVNTKIGPYCFHGIVMQASLTVHYSFTTLCW